MNATLLNFGWPASLVREYAHWSVLIRPRQPTPLSCVIVAHSNVCSLGALTPMAAAELPAVIHAYESCVRRLAAAEKFNYLALMMVDPNPHFHAIPRYPQPIRLAGQEYHDQCYPAPPDVLSNLAANPETVNGWRAMLAASWQD